MTSYMNIVAEAGNLSNEATGKNLTQQSSVDILAKVKFTEGKIWEKFEQNDDPMAFLNKCLTEDWTQSPEIRKMLLITKAKVEKAIADRDAKKTEKNEAPPSVEEEYQKADYVFSEEDLVIAEINRIQEGLREMLQQFSVKDSCDENGNSLGFQISEGARRASVITQIDEGQLGLSSYAVMLEDMYQKFNSLGFAVTTEKMPNDKEGYFFAIEMPKGFGNIDPLTMTSDQIKSAISAMKVTSEREIFAEVIGSENMQDLQDFYSQQKENFAALLGCVKSIAANNQEKTPKTKDQLEDKSNSSEINLSDDEELEKSPSASPKATFARELAGKENVKSGVGR